MNHAAGKQQPARLLEKAPRVRAATAEHGTRAANKLIGTNEAPHKLQFSSAPQFMTCTANHVGEAREARSSTVVSRELVSFSRARRVVASKVKVGAERLAIVVIYYDYNYTADSRTAVSVKHVCTVAV